MEGLGFVNFEFGFGHCLLKSVFQQPEKERETEMTPEIKALLVLLGFLAFGIFWSIRLRSREERRNGKERRSWKGEVQERVRDTPANRERIAKEFMARKLQETSPDLPDLGFMKLDMLLLCFLDQFDYEVLRNHLVEKFGSCAENSRDLMAEVRSSEDVPNWGEL